MIVYFFYVRVATFYIWVKMKLQKNIFELVNYRE